MKYRNYGNIGKVVSEIGFGAWQLGNSLDWSEMSDDESITLVHEALHLGVNFFDTAPNYGLGNSESLLGKALKNKRHKVVINTKFGHHHNGEIDFNENLLKASIEGSLSRLKSDYIDSVLLHNPPIEILEGRTNHFQIFDDLKKDGKILAYGASVDTSQDMFILMKNSNAQVIEMMFNLFYQETELAFIKAREKNIALIAKVPLDSGWLSGKYDNHTQFSGIRSRWSQNVINRRFEMIERIQSIINNGATLPQIALQFILSYSDITTVIPGTKNMRQLKDNVSSVNTEIPVDIKDEVISLWKLHIKDNPLPW